MKRSLILFAVVGLVNGSVVTAEANSAPDRVERTVEGTYQHPYVPFTGGCPQSGGCVPIGTHHTESLFTAKVTDASGLPVSVQVWAETDGDPSEDVLFGTFCGVTTSPINFPPGTELHFWIGFVYPSNEGLSSCPGGQVATTGKVSVTLSNLPAPKPVRSGTIVSGDGWLLDNQLGGCQMAPDCVSWLESGCDPSLTGRDPAVMASIVDVANLAHDHPMIFRFGPHDAGGLVLGGAVVQLWDRDCNEILSSRWRSTDCDGDASGRDCTEGRFLIPASATWMTVTGYQDNVNMVWTLNPAATGPPKPSPAPTPGVSPTPQPSPTTEPESVERSVDLVLRRHLRSEGAVTSDDASCRSQVPVVIERKQSGDWVEVGSTTSDDNGAFSLRLTDRPGRYRAIAPEIRLPERTCLSAVSTIARHRH